MRSRKTGLVALMSVGALPWVAAGQSPTPAPGVSVTPPPANSTLNPATPVGGLPAADFVTLHSLGPGTPLRHGNVLPGSERVIFDNSELHAGSDYVMDYAAGVVYLELAQHEGDTMTVSYRYMPTAANAAPVVTSLNTSKFNLMPGAGLILGVGLAERTPDGRIYSSNVLGLNNSFHFGSSSVTGLIVYSRREETAEESLFDFDVSNRPGRSVSEAGGSEFVAETMATKAMGGTAQIDYQHVSRDFTGFGVVAAGGYDAASVTRFQHEAGFTRAGESLSNLKFGGLNLSESYRTVGEDGSYLDWGSVAMSDGPLKFNWTSQSVDARFHRFKDLSEADHDQLAKEVGFSRQDWSGQFDNKISKLSFNATELQDSTNGSGIHRDEATLDTTKIKFDIGQSDVSPNFSHFQGLMAGEQALYGHDAGMHRQWLGLQAALLGPSLPFSYSQSMVGTQGGDITARDAALSGRGWTLLHIERGVDAGYASVGALQAAELDADTKAVARMYGPTVQSGPGDRAQFLAGLGVHRSYTGAAVQVTKDWNVNFDHLDLKGQQGSGTVTSVAATSKNANFAYRHEYLGDKFTEVTTMMGFEQKALGPISGLDRTDVSAGLTSGTKKLDMSHMMASTPTGAASRDAVVYHDKNIDVAYNQHTVDPNFTNISQVTNPDSGLMSTMIGFKETDASLKWQILPRLNLTASLQDTINRQTNQASRLHQMTADWSPDATTKIQFYGMQQSNHDPLSTMFASNIDRLTMSKNLGRYGVLTYADTSETFDKTVSQGLVDFHTEYVSYEAKLTAKTSVKTEESSTQFGDGEREDVSANTISTAITPRMGVSVTDVNVDHTGGSDQTPEAAVSHRNAGVWYDFGHGLMFSYGYARQLAANDGGTTMNVVTLGNTPSGALTSPDKIGTVAPGTLGDFSLAGGYGTNQWDAANRTQSFSNLSFAAVKPFRLGPLTNVKFAAQMDSSADYSNWIKEDRNFAFSSNLGPNALGLMYKSQLAASNVRAIDRGMMLVSDPSNQRWFNAAVSYKVRTLPNNQDLMIRSYALSARLVKGLSITNQLQTDPEVAQPNALLGSVAQATRSDKWKLDYVTTPNLTLGGSWEELINDASHTMARTAGMNAKLWDHSGSPVTLFYGMEQADNPTLSRTTARYSLEFDQHPGPNQTFSMFIGNISYVGSTPQGFQADNWTVRFNYQLRF